MRLTFFRLAVPLFGGILLALGEGLHPFASASAGIHRLAKADAFVPSALPDDDMAIRGRR